MNRSAMGRLFVGALFVDPATTLAPRRSQSIAHNNIYTHARFIHPAQPHAPKVKPAAVLPLDSWQHHMGLRGGGERLELSTTNVAAGVYVMRECERTRLRVEISLSVLLM